MNDETLLAEAIQIVQSAIHPKSREIVDAIRRAMVTRAAFHDQRGNVSRFERQRPSAHVPPPPPMMIPLPDYRGLV